MLKLSVLNLFTQYTVNEEEETTNPSLEYFVFNTNNSCQERSVTSRFF